MTPFIPFPIKKPTLALSLLNYTIVTFILTTYN